MAYAKVYKNASKPLCATSFGSFIRSPPVAVFLAFAKRGSSSAALCSFIFLNLSLWITTSPRSSIRCTSFRENSALSGTERIARALAVISSPSCPFPRVAALLSVLFSYTSAILPPSNFGSTTYSISISCSILSSRLICSSNSFRSSAL